MLRRTRSILRIDAPVPFGPAYEYVLDKLAIDVINGSPLLREWMDDVAAPPLDLEALLTQDERAWKVESETVVIYR